MTYELYNSIGKNPKGISKDDFHKIHEILEMCNYYLIKFYPTKEQIEQFIPIAKMAREKFTTLPPDSVIGQLYKKFSEHTDPAAEHMQ